MNARMKFWGWLSGVALKRCAKIATKTGDVHEAAHCIAALRVGESMHKHNDCHLVTYDKAYVWEFRFGDFRVREENKNDELREHLLSDKFIQRAFFPLVPSSHFDGLIPLAKANMKSALEMHDAFPETDEV